MSLDSFIHPVTRIKSYDLFWHLFIWSFTCIPQRAYLCIHMHIYIYLSSCQSINLSFQSHLMIVVRWVLCLWEQQSIWIALPSGLAVPSCICIFPCIGICQFLYFWSFLQTCRYNCWKYTMLFRYCDFMGPRLFGIYPNGQFTFGLSPFGLSWNTCRLLPFGLLWRLDYRRQDYIGLQWHLDYRRTTISNGLTIFRLFIHLFRAS